MNSPLDDMNDRDLIEFLQGQVSAHGSLIALLAIFADSRAGDSEGVQARMLDAVGGLRKNGDENSSAPYMLGYFKALDGFEEIFKDDNGH